MKPERWQRIDELFQAALERDGAERAAWLAVACAGDDGLRGEVDALLAADGEAEGFIESPAYAVAAPLIVGGDAQSMFGKSIGHYQIISLVGKGGMGEVYRARDSRLSRDVAVKILPRTFSRDAERLRRFEREARAASALNHPNIITIHEIGEVDDIRYIVTEYIEGETLRQRIAVGKIMMSEALDVAMQVASALAAAHAAGIVHRDIKPENLMMRPDGLVKVLDFGLAKLAERTGSKIDSRAPTIGKLSTEPGLVMGTPQYMSPEQARGEELDARADLFSLGVTLYEMATGHAPFKGETPAALFAELLTHEPPSPRTLNPGLPVGVEHIIGKALEKDRDLRTQSAQEMLADLKRLQRDLSSGHAAAIRPVASAPVIASWPPAHWRKWAVIAAFPVVILAGLLLWQWRRPAEPPKVTNFIPVTADGAVFDSPVPAWMMTMVTDGPRLYYSVVAEGRVVLNQISTAGGEAVTLPTRFQNALLMDISPNRSELLVANFTVGTELNAPLWILPIPGGSPRPLGELRAHAATWTPNGREIVYAYGSELFKADNNGAGARKFLSVEGRAYWLRWSPDGARLRFSLRPNQTSDFTLWEVNDDGTNLHPLLPGWNTASAHCCGNWTA